MSAILDLTPLGRRPDGVREGSSYWTNPLWKKLRSDFMAAVLAATEEIEPGWYELRGWSEVWQRINGAAGALARTLQDVPNVSIHFSHGILYLYIKNENEGIDYQVHQPDYIESHNDPNGKLIA